MKDASISSDTNVETLENDHPKNAGIEVKNISLNINGGHDVTQNNSLPITKVEKISNNFPHCN